MIIKNVLINDMEKPLGFSFNDIKINTVFTNCENTDKYTIEIYDENSDICFAREDIPVSEPIVIANFNLSPRTAYTVIINKDAESEYSTNFEMGKISEKFIGKWIGGKNEVANNVFFKQFQLNDNVVKARLYLSAQGVYQVKVNNKIISDEILAPGFTNYNAYTQIQTYDITSFCQPFDNEIEVSVGDGWFKGTLGFGDGTTNIYGDCQGIIGEMHFEYANQKSDVISTDETWQVYSGKTTASGIYYGQDLDLTITKNNIYSAKLIEGQPLVDRLSLPIVGHEIFVPKEIIKTPNGETVIDFGQNHSGIIFFKNETPSGELIIFEFSEILQEGNFYRDNLREARARFEVKSDGVAEWIHPTFTFFGYRYVKVSDNFNVNLDNIYSQSIYSDIKFNSFIKSNNKLVNKLFSNILWGQKSNFIDIPTDCPQRNERLGWTGDANVFSNAALKNANVLQFYRKYLYDVRVEQLELNGKVPMYAPAINSDAGGAAVWADVITMLPWNIYLNTSDTSILSENFQAMCDWVDWITNETKSNKNPNIWSNSFQFGDWLALDGTNPAIPSGGTDESFIATVYYFMSAEIVAKVATILGDQREKYYTELSYNIKKAILEEFITTSGKMTLNTQAGFALMLECSILNDFQKERVINDFIYRLNCDRNMIQTGFVGTPLLLPALSGNGQHNLACKIFVNESYPGWLYAVKLGATTIWERWNSVLEDGRMNPEGMNSLNHYAYGAVISWAYDYLLGIQNRSIGYKIIEVNPGINEFISEMSGMISTSYGDINLNWKQIEDRVIGNLSVPVGVVAKFNPTGLIGEIKFVDNVDKNELTNGDFKFEYQIDIAKIYGKALSINSSLFELSNDNQCWETILKLKPELNFFNDKSSRAKFGNSTLLEVASHLPFINFNDNEITQIENILKK